MDQKEFENRLDGFADKISGAVSEGVKRIEGAFDKGKENLGNDTRDFARLRQFRGSPRTGAVLIALGIAWLLYTVGVFNHPVFPVLLIVIGVYFVVRDRQRPPEDRSPE